MPWVESIVFQDGLINLMKYKNFIWLKGNKKSWAINDIHWPNTKATTLPNMICLICGSRKGKNTLWKIVHTWKITNCICREVWSQYWHKWIDLQGKGIIKLFEWNLCFIFCLTVIQCWSMNPCMSFSSVWMSQRTPQCIGLTLVARLLLNSCISKFKRSMSRPSKLLGW